MENIAEPMMNLNTRVFDILQKELGLISTLRFFAQLTNVNENYVDERKKLFADLTLIEYEQEIDRIRKAASACG